MKDDTVGFVKAPNEKADLWPQDAFQRLLVRSHDVHVDPACAQRCRNLKTNEARAHDDHTLGRRGSGNECPAVCEGAEVVNPGIRRALDLQSDRLGTRCYQ